MFKKAFMVDNLKGVKNSIRDIKQVVSGKGTEQ